MMPFLFGSKKARYIRAFLASSCIFYVCGCAYSAGSKPVTVQFPDEQWWLEAQVSRNMGERNLAVVRLRMNQAINMPFLIGIAQSSEINAFAEKRDDQTLVIFTGGFLQQFGSDPDVLAFVIGHELAHHQLGHTEPGRNQNRDIAWTASSQALGMIASYFISFSGLLVGNAVKATSLSFNRDDERAADELGMQLAIQVGYSACGEYRFSEKLEQLRQGANIPFLSTHPGNEERMENANHFQLNRGLALCGAESHG